MGEKVSDERNVEVINDEFRVTRTITEKFDAEEYLRTISELANQKDGIKKQIAEVDRKIIQQIRKDKRGQLEEIESILKPLEDFKAKAEAIRKVEIEKARKEIKEISDEQDD